MIGLALALLAFTFGVANAWRRRLKGYATGLMLWWIVYIAGLLVASHYDPTFGSQTVSAFILIYMGLTGLFIWFAGGWVFDGPILGSILFGSPAPATIASSGGSHGHHGSSSHATGTTIDMHRGHDGFWSARAAEVGDISDAIVRFSRDNFGVAMLIGLFFVYGRPAKSWAWFMAGMAAFVTYLVLGGQFNRARWVRVSIRLILLGFALMLIAPFYRPVWGSKAITVFQKWVAPNTSQYVMTLRETYGYQCESCKPGKEADGKVSGRDVIARGKQAFVIDPEPLEYQRGKYFLVNLAKFDDPRLGFGTTQFLVPIDDVELETELYVPPPPQAAPLTPTAPPVAATAPPAPAQVSATSALKSGYQQNPDGSWTVTVAPGSILATNIFVDTAKKYQLRDQNCSRVEAWSGQGGIHINASTPIRYWVKPSDREVGSDGLLRFNNASNNSCILTVAEDNNS